MRGVIDVDIEVRELLVAVLFDDAVTGLAELVRSIEDLGLAVSGVAQRASTTVPVVS